MYNSKHMKIFNSEFEVYICVGTFYSTSYSSAEYYYYGIIYFISQKSFTRSVRTFTSYLQIKEKMDIYYQGITRTIFYTYKSVIFFEKKTEWS